MRPESVFILCLDSYGDLVLRQPLFRSLLDSGRRVGVAVRMPHERLLPFLDPRLDAIVADINPYQPADATFWERAAELRARIAAWTPDLMVSGLYNRTFLDQWLLRRSSASTLGFANPALSDAELDALAPEAMGPGTPAVQRTVAVPEEAPETDKNRALLEAIAGASDIEYRPAIRVPQEDEDRARRALERLGLEAGRYAFAAPAGTVNNALKAWPREAFLGVAARLAARHALPMLLTGVASETPILQELAGAGSERGLRMPQWVGGPDDLGELLGLIRLSRLYVGSDTGPMHFAAALDVPVLALFGGGHWPRFLPAARRSFVATRQLPCFGCGWDCWLPEAACITSVDAQVLVDGADWLLAETGPGRRLETGAPLGGEVEGFVREGAARYRHTWRRAATAERYCRMLEAHRDYLQKERDALQEHRDALEIHRNALQEKLWATEVESTRRLQILQQREARIEELNEAVAHLSTAPAAFRVLTSAGLRKIGMFGVANKGLRRLKRALRPRPASPTGPAPLTAETTGRPMPLLEAFVQARSLPGDTEELALERLYHLGATLGSVICIHPTSRNAQAALMLASGGARVAWLGEESALGGVVAPGLTTPAADLGSYLIASGSSTLPGGAALLLDAGADEEDLLLLRGRLAPDTAVLLNGELSKASWSGALAETEGVKGLSVFRSVPPAWQDLSQAEPLHHEERPWVAPPRLITLPERLPSGRPWPRISVVTASFNQARYLEETLLSVLRQGYPDLEYIVVDGGSTDGSREILERYRSRLTHCIVEKDEGQAHALNKGFALATGEVLAWINSDDRYPAGALWRAALAFDTYGADMVAGGCRLVKEDDDDQAVRVHHSKLPVGRVVPLPLDRILDLDGSWLAGDFFFQPEVFWTRDIWRRSGGRVEQRLFYSMDYELWARMAREGSRIVHVPDTLAVYRMHEKQKTWGGHLPYLPELRQLAEDLRHQWMAP